MPTRQEYKQRIVHFMNQRFDEVIRTFPQTLTSSAASGASTALTDAFLGRGSVAASAYNGRQIEILELVTDGPAIGEASGITNFDGTSILTLSPALTAEVKIGTDYMMCGRAVTPELVNQAIDTVLEATEHMTLWFPSLLTDSELAALTNWADLGTPVTTEVISTTPANALFEAQYLHVLANAITEGVTSDPVNVTDGEVLLVVVFVRSDVSGVTVQLYNETAAEEIDSVTVSQAAWTEVRLSETVPSGCEQVRVRIFSDAADSDFFVSAPVILQSSTVRPYAVPSWLTKGQRQIAGAFWLPPGFSSVEADSYVALSRGPEAAPVPSELRDDRALNPTMLQLAAQDQSPLGMIASRRFAALASNSATSPADADYVFWKAVANLVQARDDPSWRVYANTAARLARKNGYGLQTQLIEENPLIAV